jgi:hypothetical protein
MYNPFAYLYHGRPRLSPPHRMFTAPNLLVVTSSLHPRIPGQQDEEEDAKPKKEAVEKVGKKQVIRGISKRTKLAIAKLLSSLDWKHHGTCLHVTLTYWKTWPGTKEAIAAEKSAITARVGEMAYCGIWRLEFQSREQVGHVAHWHLLIWVGHQEREEVSEKIRVWWKRHTGNTSVYGVMITSGSEGRASWYLAMHAAKDEQAPRIAVGRWWGYIKREKLLEAQQVDEVQKLTRKESVWFARLYRRKTKVRPRQHGVTVDGFSWFLPRAWQFKILAWVRDTVRDRRCLEARANGRAIS